MPSRPGLAGLLALLFVAGCSGGDADDSPASDAPAVETDAPKPADIAFQSLTGDVAKGETAFAQCRICHTLEEGTNLIGPSLHAIIGRKAGTVDGYRYSAANSGSDIVWSEEQLYLFLKDPRRRMPGTKMAFAGINDPQRRADLVAYIKSASQ